MKAILVEEEPEEEMKEIDLGMALQRMDSPEFPSPAEKPLVSYRFHHRKPFKPNPEGNYHISFLTFLSFCVVVHAVVMMNLCYRGKVVEGGEGEAASRDVGEHVEGDNGGSIDAIEQARQEMRHVA